MPGIHARLHARTRRAATAPLRRGFTLMEIIVVVTIIALLAGIIVPRVWQRVGTAKQSAAKTGVRALANSITTYMMDQGLSRISDDFDLDVLLLAPSDGGGASGPYLNKADDLLDPWGNRYVIQVPGEVNHDFDVISYGADGQPGGEGEDADIRQ